MADQSAYQYDVFLSFAAADQPWVKGYLLPALGLPSNRVITTESFSPGASLVGEFERAIRDSRYTAIVLTSAYLTSQWSRFTEQLASFASVAGQPDRPIQDRLIPLLKESVELPLHIDFRVRLDCTDPANWDSELGRLRALLNQPEPGPEGIPDCPYPGMAPFRVEDARFFYGREAEIEQMVRHLRLQRYLFVIGPSGSGKSSLVFGGLLPKLLPGPQRSPLFAEGFWLVRDMRPTGEPAQRLAQILGGDSASPAQAIATLLAANPPARRLLLVIDQFEELFTQTPRTSQSDFIATLKSLRTMDNCALLLTMRADFYPDLMSSDLWPVNTAQRLEIAPLRGETLGRAIQKPASDRGVYLETGLTERLLTDAADEPGVLPLLQETMVLLWSQMRRRLLTLDDYKQMGHDGRSGLAVAMATLADATVADLPPEQQPIARRIFLRLVQFGEGRPDTRRQLAIQDLLSEADAPEVFDRVLTTLVERRLLTRSGGEHVGRRVDIAHEMLIAAWPTLQGWIAERRQAEQTRRWLVEQARRWKQGHGGEPSRDPAQPGAAGGLLDEFELRDAERWLSQFAAELGEDPDLAALVAASRRAVEETRQARDAARQRELEQARALAEERGRVAEEQRRHAEAALRLALNALALALAGQAIEIAEGRPVQDDLAALLACQAHRFNLRSGNYAADRVDRALRATLGLAHLGGALQGNQAMQGHRDVSALAFDSTGRWLASGAVDGTIEIWDLTQHNAVRGLLRGRGPSPRATVRSAGCIHWLAFGRAGWSLAAIGGSGAVQVWSDWQRPSPPAPVVVGQATLLANNMGYPAIPPFAVAAGPGGAGFAFLGTGGIEVWHLPDANWAAANPEPALETRIPSAPCRALEFVDGRALVVVGASGTASEPALTIRRFDSPDEPVSPIRLQDWVFDTSDRGATLLPGIALGPSGKAVAQCPKYRTSAGRMSVWFLGQGDEPARCLPRDGDFWANDSVRRPADGRDFVRDNGLTMQFGPHSESLAAGQGDQIRLWDLRRPDDRPFLMRASEAASQVRCLAFSPTGDILASGGADVRLWRIQPGDTTSTVLATHTGGVRTVAFSPDGHTLVSCGADQKVRLWDLGRIDEDPILIDVGAWKGRLAFHNLQIRDARFQEREPLRLPFPVAFSRDGQRLAFVIVEQAGDGEREAIAVMDVQSPAVPTLLPAPLVPNQSGAQGERRLYFYAAGFESEGESLISLDFDYYTFINAMDGRGPIRKGFVRRWDLRRPGEVPVVVSELDGLEPIMAFSPDGKFLASATNDRGFNPDMTLRLWDLSQPGGTSTSVGQAAGLSPAIAFRSDGQMLASGWETGEIALWDPTRPGSAPIVLRGHRDRVWSLAFSPDGQMLASGGEDQTIRLWDLHQPRANPIVLQGHEGGVSSVAFSPDGRILASGGDDGTVRLWIAQAEVLAELLRGRLARELTREEWRQFIGDDVEYESAKTNVLNMPPVNSIPPNN